jgi:acetyltransferase-like isoleucine patch superfamily enzyme
MKEQCYCLILNVETILIIVSSDQPSTKLFAVSFDTVTYRDLQFFLAENNPHSYELERIDPVEFAQSLKFATGSYINLITKDMGLRTQVTEIFDHYNLFRFSVVHDSSYTAGAKIGPGCMIYPLVAMYTNTFLEKDIIVHSQSMIAHDCIIGAGSYISAGVNVAGTTRVGKFCQFGLGSTIFDNINIVDHTMIGAGALVRKSITESGYYVNKTVGVLTKIK